MNAFFCWSGVSEWLRLESKCCITILKCREAKKTEVPSKVSCEQVCQEGNPRLIDREAKEKEKIN